jgi:hypothetical protein
MTNSKMKNIIIICVASGMTAAAFLLGGCSDPEAKKDTTQAWAKLKLSDVAPQVHGTGQSERMLAGLEVYTYSMPAEHFDTLGEIIKGLDHRAVASTNSESLGANGFAAGRGIEKQWEPAARKLADAGCRKDRVASVFMTPSDELTYELGPLEHEMTVFCAGPDKAEGVTVGPGKAALKLQCEQATPENAVIGVVPVVEPTDGPDALRQAAKPFEFDAASVRVRLGVRNFAVIGPSAVDKTWQKPGSLYFWDSKSKVVRFYVIFCTGISSGPHGMQMRDFVATSDIQQGRKPDTKIK